MMAYAACVTYRLRPGHGPQAQAILATLRALTLAEPGCQAYEPHRDPTDPNRMFLYERYVDEAAYRAHQDTEHFARFAVAEMAEHVVDRDVSRWVTLADADAG
jgi:quinol monooxygenase YgiN